jgi:hypothetical protein
LPNFAASAPIAASTAFGLRRALAEVFSAVANAMSRPIPHRGANLAEGAARSNAAPFRSGRGDRGLARPGPRHRCRPARAYANLFAPEAREHFHPAADMAVFRQPGMNLMLDRTDLEPLFFAPFVSSVMRVEKSWIDYNGHLNMAYYNVLFDRCVDEAYELLGIRPRLSQHPQPLDLHGGSACALSARNPRRRPGARRRSSCSITTKRVHYFQQLFHAPKAGCRRPRRT